MLFNSVDFAIFLPVVFIIYWYIVNRSLRLQNLFIVAASYFFYAWWNYKFLSLIILSTIVDYFVGQQLVREEKKSLRKVLLGISIFINLSILGFFKYNNFFIENFVNAFSFFGGRINATTLNIILPVGISFYTFQTLSYTIEIYRGKLQPSRDYIAFSAFVSFFPQLVAGPIERATNLLPQFYRKRIFEYQEASHGMKQMLWGLFLKIAVADRLSLYVDFVYSNPDYFSWATLTVATIFFGIQIYSDFAGYSLIAIGVARLFGFRLMTNFNRPYLSTSFKDFWSRWHISLSSWFRDYLYIPLGGSRKGKTRTNINLILTFTISGLWHGAAWTFIAWGAVHGFYLIIEKHFSRLKASRALSVAAVFLLSNFAWIFFRAGSLNEASTIISRIFTFQGDEFYFGDKGIFIFSVMAIILVFINDLTAEYRPGFKLLYNKDIRVRYSSILLLLIYIMSLGVFDNSQFIYFQF